MNEETQNFVDAVQNDEYAEYKLEDEFVLITDWEGDGMFNPWVVVPKGFVIEDGDSLFEIIEEETEHFMSFDELEFIEQEDDFNYVHVYGAELTVE